VDLRGAPAPVGTLWARHGRSGERAAFQYDDAWLAHPERFALEPALHLDPSPQYPPEGRALFGAFGDSAPDRWGRMLITRAARREAQRAGHALPALHELDFLLGVNDETRSGALRFTALDGGPFLSQGAPAVPPIVDLGPLLEASDRVDGGDGDDDDALALLLAPGSSLGGARPKASVRDRDGSLAIAKFPRVADAYEVERWEATAIALAGRAGIVAPDVRIEMVADRAVLITRRFDRRNTQRVPFLSALTMLGCADGDRRSYPEIADVIRRYGAHARRDLEQLFRRTVFSVLISNTDDHLRNHGFLYAGPDGWELSPVFDLNPTPTDVRPRVLSTSLTVDDDFTANLDLALGEHEHYDLRLDRAKSLAAEIGRAVAEWRSVAQRHGLSRHACDRLATAFEHEDLAKAQAATTQHAPSGPPR
jgi:serine/threonine-protein kinase HipA